MLGIFLELKSGGIWYFVPDCEREFVTLCQIYSQSNLFVSIVFDFEKIGSWNREIERM